MIYLFFKLFHANPLIMGDILYSRMSVAFLMSFFICILCIKKTKDIFKKINVTERVRGFLHSEEDRAAKQKTPTMGGVSIVLAILIAVLMVADLSNKYLVVCIAVMVLFALIGFADDYAKLLNIFDGGLPAKTRFLMEIVVAIGAIFSVNAISQNWEYENILTFTFITNWSLYLGALYTIMRIFAIVGCANATNLTDGLDGLLTMPAFVVSLCIAFFAIIVDSNTVSHILIQHVDGVSELAVLCCAVAGALIGFLWFNSSPASIFMGDVGSLAIGGVISCVACIIKCELLLFVIGGVFVSETLSVVIQVMSFKLRGGKRIFKMTPIHHHFELSGVKESKISVRAFIITIMLCAFAALVTVQ